MTPRGPTEQTTAKGKRIADQGMGGQTYVPQKKKPRQDITMMFIPGALPEEDDESEEVEPDDEAQTVMFTIPSKRKDE